MLWSNNKPALWTKMSKFQDPKDQIIFTQVKHYGLEEMHNRNSHNQLLIKFILLNRTMKMSKCKVCNTKLYTT